MKFCEIAEKLGCTSYPTELDTIYENLPSGFDVTDTERLEYLHEKYNALGNHHDLYIEVAKELAEDKTRLAFANTVAAYVKNATVTEARRFLLPPSDGTIVGNLMPLYILLTLVEDCYNGYVSRGFEEELPLKFIAGLAAWPDTVKERFGIFAMNQVAFNWSFTYLKCTLYRRGVFEFEITSFPTEAMVLKNKATAEYRILMCGDRRFHRSGHILGTEGQTDETDAFGPDYTETEEAFIGHAAENGFACREISVFKKSEWERFVNPGDCILSVHIPRGTNLSPDIIRESLAIGLETAKKQYPESTPKCFYCSSWLLDPTFSELLGEGSKIAAFGESFIRFPRKSTGKELFTFAFPGDDNSNYDNLSEKTSLQRKVKALYQSGGHIYSFAGIIPEI